MHTNEQRKQEISFRQWFRSIYSNLKWTNASQPTLPAFEWKQRFLFMENIKQWLCEANRRISFTRWMCKQTLYYIGRDFMFSRHRDRLCIVSKTISFVWVCVHIFFWFMSTLSIPLSVCCVLCATFSTFFARSWVRRGLKREKREDERENKFHLI